MRRPVSKVLVILGVAAAAVWAALPSAQGAEATLPPDVFVQVVTAGAGSGQVFGPDGICVWNGTTQSGSCSGSHPPQSSPLQYTAFPASGSTFVKWEGCSLVQGQVCYVDRDIGDPTSVEIIATFGLPGETLTVTQPIGGKVGGTGINCGDGGTDCSESVAKGTKIQLTATPMPGYQFVRWEGACALVTTNVCEVTVDGPTTVGALFQSTSMSTVVVQPPMGGRIDSTPKGINCGMGATACTASFQNGTKLTLRFTAMPGYVFVAWEGQCGEFDVTVCVLIVNNSVFVAVQVKQAPPPKCKCRDLVAQVTKKGFGSAEGTGQGRRLTRFFFPVNWTLRCTAGTGKRCKGKLIFEEGPGFDVVDMYRFVKNKKGKRVRKPVKSPFTCKGKCKRNQSTVTRDTIRINMDSAKSFAQLAGGSFTFDVKTVCSGETTEYRFRVNMGPNGRVRSVTRSVLV